MTVEKTYPNGQVLTIYDDGTSPVETLKATLAKVFTASDGETYMQVVLEATENDLTSEITALDAQIATATAKRTLLANRKAALRTELNKLPARTVA